jgi:hypothetical protein
VAFADAWGEHNEEGRGKATRTIAEVTDRRFMVRIGGVRYDLAMVAWTLRSSAVVMGAVVASFAGGGCGGAEFTDATATDAGIEAASDAASDGGIATEGGGGGDANEDSFCAMTTLPHVFCDDFDNRSGTNATTVQGAWSNEVQSPDSQISIDGLATNTPSPPNSLRAQTMGDVPTETMVHALLAETIGALGPTHLLQANFETSIASYGGDGTLTYAGAMFVVSLGSLTYDLVAADAGNVYFVETSTVDAGAPAPHLLTAAFGGNVWTSTEVLLRSPTDIAAGHVKIVLTVAGQTAITALDEDLVLRTDVSLASASILLGVGLDFAVSSWDIRYDDVYINTL